MPEIIFSTKGAETVQQAQDAIRANATTNYELTTKEAKKLGRIEETILRNTETARERYNRRLGEGQRALAGNANETERLKRYQEQLATEFAKTATAAEKAAVARKVATGQATAQEQLLHAAVLRTRTATSGIGTALTEAFSPTKITGYVASFVGIQQVAKAITDELRAQQEMIDKRVSTQLTVSESRNVVLRNLVGASPEEIRGVQDAATQISGDTGVSEVAINNALASAISATGGNNNLAIDLVRQAALFLKDRPTEIGDFAGSLGDLTRVTGSVDPRVSLGYLSKIGQLSRITSPRELAANAAPALIGATSFGGDPRTAGALFASLTTGSGDYKGATSGTALIALAQQLEEASLGKGTFAQKGFSAGDIAGDTLLDRLRHLQSNPELAQKFLDAASFEKKALGPVAQLLLDPSSGARRDFENAFRAIPDNAGLTRVGGEALDVFKYNQLEPVAERKRTIDTTVENLQTRTAEDRLSTEEIEKLRSLMLESGMTYTGARFQLWAGRAADGRAGLSAGEAASVIERRANELDRIAERGDGWQPAWERQPFHAPRGEEARQQAEILREVVGELRKSNKVLERMHMDKSGLVVGE